MKADRNRTEIAATGGDALEVLANRVQVASQHLSEQYYGLVREGYQENLALTYGSQVGRDLTVQEEAWQLFTGALKTQIQGGDSWNNLQIVAVPSEVHWDDPTFGQYYFHKDSSDLINELGGTYKKSDRSFSERYGVFLSDVLRPPIDQDALTKARAALTDIQTDQDRHDTLVDNIQLNWQAFDNRQTSSLPPSKWVSMEDWYDGTYGGTQHSDKNVIIKSSAELVLATHAIYLQSIQKAFGGQETLYKRIAQFQDAKLIEVTSPRTDSSRPAGKKTIYPYQISPDFPGWLADAKAGKHQLTKFTIRHGTYSYDYSSTSIGAGIGVSFGFFGT